MAERTKGNLYDQLVKLVADEKAIQEATTLMQLDQTRGSESRTTNSESSVTHRSASRGTDGGQRGSTPGLSAMPITPSITLGNQRIPRSDFPGTGTFALASSRRGWFELFKEHCQCESFKEKKDTSEKAKRHWEGCPNNVDAVDTTCPQCGTVFKGRRNDNLGRHLGTCPGRK